MTRGDSNRLLGDAIEAALAGGAADPHEDVSAEELALLATGRVDELAPPSRQRVLRAVASDRLLARVVAEVATAHRDGLFDGSATAVSAVGDHPAEPDAPGSRSGQCPGVTVPAGRLDGVRRDLATAGRLPRWYRWSRWALAAAACLLAGLLVWRAADPPAPLTMADGEVTVYQADPGPVDYWSQVEAARLDARYRRDHWRDVSIAALAVACAVLAVPAGLALLRQRGGRTD